MYVNYSSELYIMFWTDESDDEEGRPSRRRRLGERAAEGADDDEDVCHCLLY